MERLESELLKLDIATLNNNQTMLFSRSLGKLLTRASARALSASLDWLRSLSVIWGRLGTGPPLPGVPLRLRFRLVEPKGVLGVVPPPNLAFEGLVSLDVSRLPRGMPEDLRALPMVDEGYLGV